jgi:hypothetical protein
VEVDTKPAPAHDQLVPVDHGGRCVERQLQRPAAALEPGAGLLVGAGHLEPAVLGDGELTAGRALQPLDLPLGIDAQAGLASAQRHALHELAGGGVFEADGEGPHRQTMRHMP